MLSYNKPIMNKTQYIIFILDAQQKEFDKAYADLTMICRYDAALADIRECTDENVESVLNKYHKRVFNSLSPTND